MIGPKETKFSGFDGGHPGVPITKLGEDWKIGVKPCLGGGGGGGGGLFSPKISWLESPLYA